MSVQVKPVFVNGVNLFACTGYFYQNGVLFMERSTMPVIPERFIQARMAKGWDQKKTAEIMGITQQSVSDIEIGEIERPRTLHKFATEAGVSQAWLLGETDDPTPVAISKQVSYPIPMLKMEQVESWLNNFNLPFQVRIVYMQFSKKNVRKGSFFVQIEGDSMVSPYNVEESYFPGHWAYIDPKLKPTAGDGVLVKIDKELKLRKLAKDGTEFVLEALNPKYGNTKLDKNTKISGTVLWTQRIRHDEGDELIQQANKTT